MSQAVFQAYFDKYNQDQLKCRYCPKVLNTAELEQHLENIHGIELIHGKKSTRFSILTFSIFHILGQKVPKKIREKFRIFSSIFPKKFFDRNPP